MPRLLIAASGTGGHIYPALALADSLSNSWKIDWLGVPNRLEIELVPEKYNWPPTKEQINNIALSALNQVDQKVINVLVYWENNPNLMIFDPQIDPQTPQDRSKNRSKRVLKAFLFYVDFSVRF